MKVHLSTLGCKLNESELEAWARRFTDDGYELVNDPQSADLVVLNTCTVTHVAARKSRQMARQLARTNPKARLVLTGCFTDIAPGEAKALPNVALVVPNADKDRLVTLAGGLLGDTRFQTTETGCRLPKAASGMFGSAQWLDADVETQAAGREPLPVSSLKSPTSNRQLLTARTRTFVKIQDGCNMSCTYCIIPLARGKERSRPITEVVAEIKALVNAGYKEIILTGVQISAYRSEIPGFLQSTPEAQRSGAEKPGIYVLRDLVAMILAETAVPRLRLTSIAPWDLDESLLDLWHDPHLCRHLHLSLQSGSDTVLRRMRRPYTTAQFARAVETAREKIPDLGITTDVIVGFPGESDVEFEQSLKFVEQMQFSRVHVFPYSERAGTVAASLPLHVTDSVKESRVKQVQSIANASMRAFAQRFIGRALPALWETRERTTDARWSGYTDNYIRVVAPSESDLTNTITPVRLISVADDTALGEMG